MARKSAEERREEIVTIALHHFAQGGFHGTSTEAIAREAGISQPYLFRLFKTKRELFIACTDRCFAHVTAVFAANAQDGLDSMGPAYGQNLLPDRDMLLFQMQAYVADDPEIRTHVRANFGALVRRISELGNVPLEDTWDFFAQGMLFNVTAALDMWSLSEDEDWAKAWAALAEGG
jgi:AcrR family transcriptional regulator